MSNSRLDPELVSWWNDLGDDERLQAYIRCKDQRDQAWFVADHREKNVELEAKLVAENKALKAEIKTLLAEISELNQMRCRTVTSPATIEWASRIERT